MRKSILAVLMVVMVSVPCVAQEIEPDRLFSLHGTLWKVFITGNSNIAEWVGFYGGAVYPVYNNNIDSYGEQTYLYEPLWFGYGGDYVDFGVASIFWARGDYGPGIQEIHYGILQPIGLGMIFAHGVTPVGIFPIPAIGIMFKVDDNWRTPEDDPEPAPEVE